MPEHEPPTHSMKETVAELGVRVGALEGGLETVTKRLEEVARNLSNELSAGLQSLGAQLAERSRTPWPAVFAGITVVVTICTAFAYQSLTPMQRDIDLLKHEIVPRVEQDDRNRTSDRRIDNIEQAVKLIDQQRYQEMQHEIETLKKAQQK